MRIALSLRVAALAGMFVVLPAGAQVLSSTISTTSGVTLKTFTPVDSFYLNPTATSFSIALVHTVSGSPTDYRVSRFSDFRDANWIPYVVRPTTTVQRSVFPAVTNGGTQITLYFQLRTKNPKAGQPISVVGAQTTVQPDFFFSDPLGRRIRLVYAG
jgi:hypothetical protein